MTMPNKHNVRPAKSSKTAIPIGVVQANEALNHLTRIPRNDPERKVALRRVLKWIEEQS